MRVGAGAPLIAALVATLAVRPIAAQAAPRATDLAGARDRPGLFTQRLILPAGFCGPLHTHDGDLHGLVLRGALRMGFADSAGKLVVQEHPPGSFVVVPAGRRHVEGSAVETEIHLSGVGPLGTTVVDGGEPQRCTADAGRHR
jgi:quercetin dioxygenase-like cupin family protein